MNKNIIISDCVVVEYKVNHWYYGSSFGQFGFRMINICNDETDEEYLHAICSIIEHKVYKYDEMEIKIHYIIDNKLYTNIHKF